MDYTVQGILQATRLEWVAFPFSRGSSRPRDRIQVSQTAGRFFTSWATREAQEYWAGNPRDSGAWWAAVYGVAQSQTWLKRLSSSSSSIPLSEYVTIISIHFVLDIWMLFNLGTIMNKATISKSLLWAYALQIPFTFLKFFNTNLLWMDVTFTKTIYCRVTSSSLIVSYQDIIHSK